jgi:cellulose synthase (UDP-forming)
MRNGADQQGLWQFKQAKRITTPERFVLLVLVLTGIIFILRFADWWFRREHIGYLPMYIVLSLAFWYGISRLILIWINYLRIGKPEHKPVPQGLKVAIFTTSSPGEPAAMFEKTLAACANITYPHTTYLLDDTRDPAFRAIAEKHGAVWLELVGIPGAKAGKINKALEMIDADFILVLDPDHIPFPCFLDHTLGYFEDERIGFVQVSQAYYNQYRSFTAKGAAEQTYTFYGPTQMSLYGYGCSVAIGANCTFRKKALQSIGGHGIGLAEDLITAIRLHAAGWRSVYNPVVVSRGLVPEDLGSFCKQQLKWARGVFEVTFNEVPRLFRKLTWWQRLSYNTIGTYYLVGATQFIFTLIPFIFFLTGILPAQMDFVSFIIYGMPVLVCAVAIYLYVQRWMCDPDTERGLHWRGMVLKFACWPVFFLGFLLAIVNAEIPYIPTAKKAVTGYVTPFVRPMLVHIFVFLITVTGVVVYRKYYMPESRLLLSAERTWGMVGFAFLAFVMALGGVYAAMEARNLKEEEPWDTVNVNGIDGGI